MPAEKLYEQQLGTLKENRFKKQPAIMEGLKGKAQKAGLWNLFLTKEYHPLGAGLTNYEYAQLCEMMGRAVKVAPEACNCNAPDTGNMELLVKYANEEQKLKYLKPLLEGHWRSAFAMTEPGVASSDATNIRTSITREGDSYVIHGRKWWISNAGHPNCKFFLVLGVSDPNNAKHKRHSIIIVPRDAPGVKIVRPLTVFGYDDAAEGHFEVVFDQVRVPGSNLILGQGRGFEIIQGRLGPGRIHHCMRAIGMAERGLEAMVKRAKERKAFGKLLAEQSSVIEQIAYSRVEIEQARLLVLNAAKMIDEKGAKGARREIAMIKVAVPQMLCRVLDRAIQLHGGAGVGPDSFLAEFYAAARVLRIVDGPDAVHLMQIGKYELRQSKL